MSPRSPLFENPQLLIARVYSFVAARIGGGQDAEDVTSAVFERALRYESSYDASRGTPLAWLIGIARRELAEQGRTPSRPSAAAVEPDGQDPAESVAERVDLWAAVATLDERDRELVALRYAADLSARRIAGLLGLRTNTVEVALHRALRRLERELGEPVRRSLDVRPMPARFVARPGRSA